VRGAKPKPSHLKVIAGNPGRRPLNKREPKPSGDLKAAPDWMTVRQIKIWDEAIRTAPKGLLKELDESILSVWVIARDMHQQASAEIAQSGLMTTTPKTGDSIQSPYVAVVNRQALIMMKAAAEMGFTPSSRSRVAIDDAGEAASGWDGF
jgi:P27 family predicted phage terminase small subunit